MEVYTDKYTESEVCDDCTYMQNSISDILSDDFRSNIYFDFKILNAL